MQDLGGKILPIGFDLQLDPILHGEKIELGEIMPDWLSPVLYLPVLQLASYYRSMAKGLNPDKPTNLDAVVKLDTL